MANKPYTLHLFELPDRRTALEGFESEQPFAPISVGDYINDQFLRDDGAPGDPLLRVVQVTHVLAKDRESGSAVHHVNVYTEREPG